jgi:hypothetical protein
MAVPSLVKEYCANLIRLHQIGEKRMARLRRGIFVVETPDTEPPIQALTKMLVSAIASTQDMWTRQIVEQTRPYHLMNQIAAWNLALRLIHVISYSIRASLGLRFRTS